jgi:hypothetical protein
MRDRFLQGLGEYQNIAKVVLESDPDRDTLRQSGAIRKQAD